MYEALGNQSVEDTVISNSNHQVTDNGNVNTNPADTHKVWLISTQKCHGGGCNKQKNSPIKWVS